MSHQKRKAPEEKHGHGRRKLSPAELLSGERALPPQQLSAQVPGLRGRPRILRDPVHGDIPIPRNDFGKLIESIIDTRMFQRLRTIRQNGVMNYVFHGAEHSRFSHSIGASYVAGQMFAAVTRNSQLKRTEQDYQDTVLATLLHDVGHGPFSHTLEEILKGLKGSAFDHEKMTVRIIAEDQSDICRHLRAYDPGLLARLPPYIDKKRRIKKKWHYLLVSSQLDADRIDYLARDGLMSGVHHRFDHKRLIDSLTIHEQELVVDFRAADVAESFLLAMEEMYAVAYYHKTVRAAAALLGAVIRRAIARARHSRKAKATLFPVIDGFEDPLWSLVESGDAIDLSIYQCLTEHHVWTLIGMWSRSKDFVLSDLATRLLQRRLPKAVSLEGKSPTIVKEAEEFATEEFKRKFPDLKGECDYYVISDVPDRVSYKRPTLGEGASSSIRLLRDDGSLVAVEERERSIAQVISTKVYFPRLIVPIEIRSEVEQFVRGKK